MNLKKILILPAGFILIHVLYIGCCKCVDGAFHKEITSLRATEIGDKNFYSKDSVKVIDTLFSTIEIRFDWVAKNKINPIAGLVNSAYAFSCRCGSYTDLGFKYKIDSLVITSDNIFKGEPAGKNIANKFTGLYTNYINGANSYLTIPQLIDSINSSKEQYGIGLFTTANGLTNKMHRFKYQLFTNGKNFEAVDAKLIIWQ